MATYRPLKLSGQVFFGTYDPTNGVASQGYVTNLRPVSCAVATFEFTPDVTLQQITERCTAARALYAEVPQTVAATLTVSMESVSTKELAIAMSSDATTVAGDAITGESLGTPAAGDYVFTRNPDISLLTITDSEETPVPLVVDVNYEIVDAKSGKLRFIDVAGFTGPFVADYTHGGHTNMELLSNLTRRVAVVFDGINYDNEMRMLVTIPQWSAGVDGSLPLIGDEAVNLSMTGGVLYSGLNAEDALLGPFGKAVYLETP